MANQKSQRIAPPIPFLTAVWAGMSHEDILAGLRSGDIVRPGRLPDWAAELESPASTAGNDTVDRARVSAWFTALDPDLSPSAFDAIWNRSGGTDGERVTKLSSYLSNLLLEQESGGAVGDRPSRDRAAALDAYFADARHHAKIVDLTGKTGEDLAALAKTDVGYRYALAHLDSFALTGSRALFADANVDGSLDRFDADTGEALVSDAWIGDRGKFLAWKLSEESGETMAVAGNQDWTFIDRGIKGTDGKPLTLEIKTGATDAGQNQVIFGTAEDEMFKGVAGSDRIYAGAGDDVLRGGAGGDRLEGGDGDDLAMGGAGNDEVSGGRGNDELDGGGGDDRLEGGSGDDTYVIDAGDGADSILDSDGVGTIELGGSALRGTMQGADGKWVSADRNVEFTFDGDLSAGGTLTVSVFADGADHDRPAQNTVTVTNWKNGDLGITLGENVDDDSGPEPSSLESLAGPEVPVASSEDLTSETWEDENALSLDGSGNVTGGASNAGGDDPFESQFDFDSALNSLLGSSGPTLQTVDPTSYQQAIEAFSGVLEPPDVSAAGVNLGNASAVGAVTESAMADALAASYDSDSFDSVEPTQAGMVAPIDVATLMDLKETAVGVRSRAGG